MVFRVDCGRSQSHRRSLLESVLRFGSGNKSTLVKNREKMCSVLEKVTRCPQKGITLVTVKKSVYSDKEDKQYSLKVDLKIGLYLY